MKRLSRMALAGLLLSSPAALGFNSDEHKRLGDEASSDIPVCTPQQVDRCRPAIVGKPGKHPLFKGYDPQAPGEARLITTLAQRDFKAQVLAKQPAYETNRLKGQVHYMQELYVPPLHPNGPPRPLLVWVGSSESPEDGQWFTFGDLIALYGDYRRAVTCGAEDNTCLLSDALDSSTPLHLGHLRNFARGEVPPFGSWGNATGDSGGTSEDTPWWGDEMLRLAFTNDWHFQNQAIHWYAGMHRQALAFARLAAEKQDPSQLWKALHYEANGLHSLTDLFAPGHLVVNRQGSVAGTYDKNKVTRQSNTLYAWFQQVLDQGKPVGSLPAPLAPPTTSEIPSWSLAWSWQAITEEEAHTGFNKYGALLKNQNGDSWTGFGDGKLFPRKTATGNVVDEAQWLIAKRCVTDSLQSLFDAYASLTKAAASTTDGKERGRLLDREVVRLSSSPEFFKALRSVPIEVKNACAGPGKCLAVRDWKATRYRADVLGILQVPALPSEVIEDVQVTGADWKIAWDAGRSETETERLKVPADPVK